MSDQPSAPPESQELRPRLLTVAETSTALRISRWSVYQLINSGRLRTVKIDRRRLVAPEDLDSFIEGLRKGGGINV